MSAKSKWAASLAAVAIAGLVGGPVVATGAALTEFVNHLQSWYSTNEATRSAHRLLTKTIKSWAKPEGLEDAVEGGLELATLAVARWGLTSKDLFDLEMSPERARRKVVAAARQVDSGWSYGEDPYVVAESVIELTYQALITQLQDEHGVVVAAVKSLRNYVDAGIGPIEKRVRENEDHLDQLRHTLTAPATRQEVVAYLQARISDWDRDVWAPGRTASSLERRLRVRTDVSKADTRSADDVLVGQRMLVVLGGPGSGKTWLARRYARRAAEEALAALEDGAGLGEVELPLFTTWDQWAKTHGASAQEALVRASFEPASGHLDIGDAGTVDRLIRTFALPDTRVLAVIDSLDEAADATSQVNRFEQLAALSARWRVIVTSRAGAWDATRRGETNAPGSPRVAELQELAYPRDVHDFIHAWFDTTPARGSALIQQIGESDRIAQTARIPLMLSFYCLLAADPAPGVEALPVRRRELYRRLVRRLVRANWVTPSRGPDTAPDPRYCEEMLAGWAWDGVRDQVNTVGLGQWGDTFIQPTAIPRTEARRAIDHVAPKIGEDDEGTITRRFIHRTFLEHFVAEHIATLTADEAAEILLPHLWFDPDWKMAAPAAIIAHNHNQQGALLQRLLDDAWSPVHDGARNVAHGQVERLLLALVEESSPDDWSLDHRELLDAARVSGVINHPKSVARSTHWTFSNPAAGCAVRHALPNTRSRDLPDLVMALSALATDEDEMTLARRAILNALPNARSDELPVLTRVLIDLGTNEEQRVQLQELILRNLVHASRDAARPMASALVRLVTGDEDRARVLRAVLDALPDSSPWVLPYMAAALSVLVTNEAERATARKAVIRDVIPRADWVSLPTLIRNLSALVVDERERADLRHAILQAVPDAAIEVRPKLVSVMGDLNITEEEQAQLRQAILDAIPNSSPITLVHLIPAALRLSVDEPGRSQIRLAILHALPDASFDALPGLVAHLADLATDENQRARALQAILDDLPRSVRSAHGAYLVSKLAVLATDEGKRTQASTAILEALPDSSVFAVKDLVMALSALVTDKEERAQVRQAVLRTLSHPKSHATRISLAAIPVVATDESERAEARQAILDVFPRGEPQALPALVEVMSDLAPGEVERAQIWHAILGVVPGRDPAVLHGMLEAAPPLPADEDGRAQIRQALLRALPEASPEALPNLAAILSDLAVSENERSLVRQAILEVLPHASYAESRRLVAQLADLVPEKGEARARAIHAVVGSRPPWWVLSELLTTLGPMLSEYELAKVRQEILEALPHAYPSELRILVPLLRASSPITFWLSWLKEK